MILFYTFGFVWRSEDAVRAVVDMDYVASEELGNFVRLGFVLDVQFTYVVRSTLYHTSKHVQRTLDDVQDSWTMVVCVDRLAGANFTDRCQ